MIQRIGTLPPVNGCGGKANGLDLLIKHGLPVPEAFTLLAEEAGEQRFKPGLYAVRSSAASEDGKKESKAGIFHSFIRVKAEDVAAAALKTGTPSVIVQDWIEPQISGVAFSRHPTKDMECMVIDTVRGSNEQLLTGELSADRVFAWSDTSLRNQDSLLSEMLINELRLLVNSCAEIIQTPADVEWAWDGNKLWILQARPITRIPQENATDREEERLMRLFAVKPDLILDRNDFAESSPRPDKATLEAIKRLYVDNGPFKRAADELGLQFNSRYASEYLQTAFDWLYADPSKQPISPPRGFFAGIRMVLRLSSELTKFAKEFYSKDTDPDLEKTYAKASILIQFAQSQATRPVPQEIWDLRQTSSRKKHDWNKPSNLLELYAIIREDAKIMEYVNLPEILVPPVRITSKEAMDLLRPVLDTNGLGGQGVSAGFVEGSVRVQTTPAVLDKPAILVVQALTPDWFSFLDKNVSGIISETGSSMSHGAIQCRERGIPAVFGVVQAAKKLQNGERIQLNGKTGEVKLKK